MDPAQARQMTERFQQLMIEKRNRISPEQAAATAHTYPFYQELQHLAAQPAVYNTPSLIDEALKVIDLGLLYEEADLVAPRDLSLGHQDHLIRALLRWFKEDFFTWVTTPPCDICSGETDAISVVHPSEQEKIDGAGRTELYRCKMAGDVHANTRFPRYDKPTTLLNWRKGRCGEFANCFTLFCVALGSRARWVWNAEDHVWTEVYSHTLQRWVAMDACENSWDTPTMYATGWGKKMSYCIAFSDEGAKDVTRRYVRKPEQALPRTRVPEMVLQHQLQSLTRQIRWRFSPSEEAKLAREDLVEEAELASFVEEQETTSTAAPQARQSGTAEWTHARGEDGA